MMMVMTSVAKMIAIMMMTVILSQHPTSAMQQIEIDRIEQLQLSNYDGYKFNNERGHDGYYSFFYLLPTSSRSEKRTSSGEVSGQYAFVAPEGDEFQFRYNADREGYRVESNALPVPPEDTEDVKRAKEEFFAAYQKALELAGSDEEDSDESSSEESSEEGYYQEESEESSEEDSDESEEESSEEEGSEEEEIEAEQTQTSFAFQNPFKKTSFGQKLRKPYPYYGR